MKKKITLRNLFKFHLFLFLFLCLGSGWVNAQNNFSLPDFLAANHLKKAKSKADTASQSLGLSNPAPSKTGPSFAYVTPTSFVVNWPNAHANYDQNAYQAVFISKGDNHSISLNANYTYYNFAAFGNFDWGNYDNYLQQNNGQIYTYNNWWYYWWWYYYPLNYDFNLVRSVDYDYSHNYPNNQYLQKYDFYNTNYSGGFPGSQQYQGPSDASGNWVCVHNSTRNDHPTDTLTNLEPNTKYTVMVVNYSYNQSTGQLNYNTTFDSTNSAVVKTPRRLLDLSTDHIAPSTQQYGSSSVNSVIIQGKGLSGGVILTAPAGFLLSTLNQAGSNAPYQPVITLQQNPTGTVNSTILIRSREDLPVGIYQGNIMVHTDGTDDVPIVIDRFTITQAPLLIKVSAVTKNYGDLLTNTISSTGFVATGLQNLETLVVTLYYGTGSQSRDAVGTYISSVTATSASPIQNAASNTPSAALSSAFTVSNTPSPASMVPYAEGTAIFNAGNYHIIYSANNLIVLPSNFIQPLAVALPQKSLALDQTSAGIMNLRTDANLIGNLISPNSDGQNDFWIIKNIQNYPRNKVTVYDRKGAVVFSKAPYANDWAGTNHGKVLAEGTYFYLVDFGPGERKVKGFITLVKGR